MRIGIAIPTPQVVSTEFAIGNLPLIISDAKKKGHQVSLMYKGGVRTDSNRNHMLNEYLKTDVEAILWLDADQIYPADIIDTLVKADVDIIGSVYYKRSEPYDPVIYIKNGREVNPYSIVDIHKYPPVHLEVDGIGFGGTMVKMDVYHKMGDDKWMEYGKNFGRPDKDTDKESHDLIFCQRAQKHGFKIYIHNGVQCYHIAEYPVGRKDHERCRRDNA